MYKKSDRGLVINQIDINMENNLNIGTWNLCLGLANKRDAVTEYLKMNEVSVCCLQETDIPVNYPEGILNCNDYVLELETCDNYKKRAAIYIAKDIVYNSTMLVKGHELVSNETAGIVGLFFIIY